MSEFNPREYFEQQAGMDARLYMQVADIHRRFSDELVAFVRSTQGTGLRAEDVERRIQRGGVDFVLDDPPVAPLGTEQTGTGWYRPDGLQKVEQGPFVLGGSFFTEAADVDRQDAEIIMFLLAPEAATTMMRGTDAQRALEGLSPEQKESYYGDSDRSAASQEISLLEQAGGQFYKVSQTTVLQLLQMLPQLNQYVWGSVALYQDAYGID